MKNVCKLEKCTMCRACSEICPQKCITDTNKDGAWFMEINEEKCIQCGLCKNVCINEGSLNYNKAQSLFVGWSNNNDLRKKSASGGIAASLYGYALEKKQYICGVEFCNDFRARYYVTNNEHEIRKFLNSKYTFSDMAVCYKEIYQLLQNENEVLFIGLPCHVAAVVKFLEAKKCSTELLTTVDIVCHGTPSPELLVDHIKYLENKYKFNATRCYFRDANFASKNYYFTLYGNSEKKPVYKKLVESDDCYQIGYHNAYIYRDCCYQCKFAKQDRMGDLSLFDSTGLGKVKRFNLSKDNTSFILVNTDKGMQLFKKLKNHDVISCEPRPLDEAYKYNGQLNKPSAGLRSIEREMFFANLNKGMSFDEAATIAFHHQIKRNRIRRMFRLRELKILVKNTMASKIMDKIQIMKNSR